MTARELARLALETLDAQQSYFGTPSGAPAKLTRLNESKALERRLRAEARKVLTGEETPSLFGGDA